MNLRDMPAIDILCSPITVSFLAPVTVVNRNQLFETTTLHHLAMCDSEEATWGNIGPSFRLGQWTIWFRTDPLVNVI